MKIENFNRPFLACNILSIVVPLYSFEYEFYNGSYF